MERDRPAQKGLRRADVDRPMMPYGSKALGRPHEAGERNRCNPQNEYREKGWQRGRALSPGQQARKRHSQYAHNEEDRGSGRIQPQAWVPPRRRGNQRQGQESADGISRARKDERRCERNGEDQRTCEPGPRARRKQRKSDDGQRRAVNSVDCPRRRIFVGPQLQRERQNAGDNQQDAIHRQKRGLLLNHKRVLSSISRPSVSSLGRSASFNSVSRHVNGRVAQSGRPKEWRITFRSDRGAIQALAETK